MSYDKQTWNKYDDLKTEEENIENGAVVTDNRMNHMETGIGDNDNNLASHIADTSNPHKVTAEQVGLDKVVNIEQASKVEFDSHTSDTSNPHEVTAAQVGLDKVVNIEQASKEEFDNHANNKSNPHAVTASQVGAYSKAESDSKLTDLSTAIEAKADDSKVVHNTGDETISGTKTFTSPIVAKAVVEVTTIPSGNLGASWNGGSIDVIKIMNLCIIQVTNLTPASSTGTGTVAIATSSAIPKPRNSNARGVLGLISGTVNSAAIFLNTNGGNQQLQFNAVLSSTTGDSWSGLMIYDY